MIKREDQLVIFQIKLPRLLHLSHRNPAELAATKPYQLYAPGRRQHVSDRQILCLLKKRNLLARKHCPASLTADGLGLLLQPGKGHARHRTARLLLGCLTDIDEKLCNFERRLSCYEFGVSHKSSKQDISVPESGNDRLRVNLSPKGQLYLFVPAAAKQPDDQPLQETST